MLVSNNKDIVDQHFRLSHFLKNVAEHSAKYNLTEQVGGSKPSELSVLLRLQRLSIGLAWLQVEVILVDYNSNPNLPPLWNTSSVKMPSQTATLPLIRVVVVPRIIHKVGHSPSRCVFHQP